MEDPHVIRLADFFAQHPLWRAAAKKVQRGATSNVYFQHLPGERHHLVRTGDGSELRPGPTPDPDFVFRFTPASIDRITRVDGEVADFAIELFSLALDPDPEQHVDIRIVASLVRLTRRGYVGLLLAAGPRLLAFGASHGVRHLGDLRRLVRDLRARQPAEWEQG